MKKKSKDPYFKLMDEYEDILTIRTRKLYEDLMLKTQRDLINLYNQKNTYGATDYYNSIRYIELINNLNKRLLALGIQQNNNLDSVLKKMAKDIKAQIAHEVPEVMNSAAWNMDTVVKTIWCKDGKDYSQRIWTNTETVKQTLTDGIAEIIMRGGDESTLVNDLIPLVQNTVGSAMSRATTLARTELAYVRAQTTLEAYKAAGFKYYIFYNTADNSTCDECSEHNGQVFEVANAVIGENFPPLHPNCRGWTRAVHHDQDDWAQKEMEAQSNV